MRAGGFAHRGRVRDPLGAQRRLRDARPAPPHALSGVDGCGARRVRRPRHRGQDRRGPVRPRARHPDPRAVPRPAVHDHRGGPPPGRPGGGQLAGVRPRDAATRSSPPWPTRRTSSPARATWAARCGWAATRPTLRAGLARRPRPTARPRSPSGTGTGTRSNNAYRDRLTEAGLVIRGTSPDGRLVEFVELRRDLHPFFVATQAHPELKSRPTRPHPLFAGFVGAALDYHEADRLPVPLDGRARRSAPDGATEAHEYRVVASEPVYEGRVISLRRDTVAMPGGGDSVREVVAPPRRGRRRRARRRGPASCCSASTGTPSARTCGSCRPGCATPTASRRWRPRSGSWPRRRCWPPARGRC